MKLVKNTQPDPLYVIFEEHLLNFQDSDADRRTFIGNIVLDYITYLRKMNIIVPKNMEMAVYEELGAQVNTMLVKKIYGCPSVVEYQKGVPMSIKKRAKRTYKRLKKVA